MSGDRINSASAEVLGRSQLTAARLRRDFDVGFAQEYASRAVDEVDCLVIRVGEAPYALRLSELMSLHADRKLVPVPSAQPALLGLAGLRGMVLPVFDLRRLLGAAPGPSPRWLAVVRAAAPIAVAFDELEAHLRVARTALLAGDQRGGAASPFLRGSVVTGAHSLPLIDLPSLAKGVAQVAGRGGSPQAEERR